MRGTLRLNAQSKSRKIFIFVSKDASRRDLFRLTGHPEGIGKTIRYGGTFHNIRAGGSSCQQAMVFSISLISCQLSQNFVTDLILEEIWLPPRDSNPDMLIQSRLSADGESSGFLLSNQRHTPDQARTEALGGSIEKARFGA